MGRSLRVALAAGLLAVAACGEDEPAESGCACSEAICEEARCTLRVINECPEQWGLARVFVNDTGADAEPAGVAAADNPYESCQGFAVGEGFTFLVESEDARTISETAGANFMCDANRPFEFKLDCGR